MPILAKNPAPTHAASDTNIDPNACSNPNTGACEGHYFYIESRAGWNRLYDHQSTQQYLDRQQRRHGPRHAHQPERLRLFTNPGGVFIVTNVCSINADGTNDIPLTDDNSVVGGGTTNSSDPVWSPDGAKIIFNSARAWDGTHLPSANSIPNIWIINSADGSGRLPLTFYTVAGIVPTAYAWLPNSNKIVYGINAALTGDAFGIPNIWVLDTTVFPLKPTSLTNFTTTASFLPSISPDGTRIAFVSERALDGTDTANTNYTANIWVMNADGSAQKPVTKVTAIGTDSSEPNWHP